MTSPADKKPMTKRMLIMIGAVLLLVVALAFGFYLHIQKLIASSPKPGPQVVTAIEAQSLEWQPRLSAVGTVVAARGVDVTTEVAGQVRSVNFRSGQDVGAGQVLVQLNADPDIAQLQALQASAELAAVVLERDRQQLAAQAISHAQVDADAADLKSKRALLAQQEALVARKAIKAPFSGKLGISTVEAGQYLNPADRIVTLQNLDTVHVDFFLPQKNLARLALGQPVNVSTDSFPGRGFAGKITAISPKVDPATRNVQLRATLANPRHELLPGMFANANVDVGEKKRYLTLPQTAITYNPYGATVFVVTRAGEKLPGQAASAPASPPAAAAAGGAPKDGLVAQQVFITTGETRGDQVAVLSGLKEGQQVVTSGQNKLKNGTSVVVDNTVQPANNPAPAPQEK